MAKPTTAKKPIIAARYRRLSISSLLFVPPGSAETIILARNSSRLIKFGIRSCNRPCDRANWAGMPGKRASFLEEPAMKFHVGLLAAAAVAVLAGPGRAADSDQFVIRGDATKTIVEQNEIPTATAEAVGKACIEEAVRQGVKVSIAIYDQFGEPVYIYRMDGQAKIAIETAIMKARTVLNTHRPSKATMN